MPRRRWGVYRRDDNTWAVRAGDHDVATGIAGRQAAVMELTRQWQTDGLDDTPAGEVPFTLPLVIAEGVETGDGRIVDPGALTWRDLPLPFMLLTETGWGHDGAVIAGRIDELHRVEATTDLPAGVAGAGAYIDTEDGATGAQLASSQAVRGVSADVDDIEVEIEDVPGAEPDADGWMPMRERLLSGRIMGATQCPFPAFMECTVEVDAADVAPEPEGNAAAVASTDGEEAFADCAPCQEQARDQAAAASGPLRWAMTVDDSRERPRRRAVTAAAPARTSPAARVPLAPAGWFEDPAYTDETTWPIEGYEGVRGAPLTITADGRVHGHMGLWGVCHTGYPDRCVTMPRDVDGSYSYFRTGSVRLDSDALIATGALTVGTGHADLGLDWNAAAAHYDNTGAAVADVACGEDGYGIWVAGWIRPGSTPEQVYALQASGLSGDWRWVGGATRLVASLAVNVPGFPVARPLVAGAAPVEELRQRVRIRNGHVHALVAAGGARPLARSNDRPWEREIASLREELRIIRASVQPLMRQAGDLIASGL